MVRYSAIRNDNRLKQGRSEAIRQDSPVGVEAPVQGRAKVQSPPAFRSHSPGRPGLSFQGSIVAFSAVLQIISAPYVIASQTPLPIAPPLTGMIGRNYNECLSYAHQAQATRNWQAAVDNYKEAMKYKPNEAELHLGLALAYDGLAMRTESLQEAFKALELRPDLVEARFFLGHSMMKSYDWDEAAGQFLQVLRVHPNDIATRGNLGICYEAKGQLDSAIEQLRYVTAADPKSMDGHYNLACAYDMKEDWDSALIEYKRAIALNGKHSMAWTGIASCLLNKRDLKSAEIAAKKAIELDPNSAYAWIVLGRTYELNGQDNEAQSAFKKAIRLQPDNPFCQKLMKNLIRSKAKKLGLPLPAGLD